MPSKKEVPCIKINQWLEQWKPKGDVSKYKKAPEKHFYMFKMNAKSLQILSGVNPRTTENREKGNEELGIQRRLNKDRIREIKKFIQHGYPLSGMRNNKIMNHLSLTHPGWLPSAIIINIRKEDDGLPYPVDEKDLVNIKNDNQVTYLELPNDFDDNWERKKSHPLQIIDGQHRLYAFESLNEGENFEFPVIAFHGLDIGWQAYLFWVINIKPKRIDSSLAFDLFPLLRDADWLDITENENIYREARAQEIVDKLWKYPNSPWYKNIDMLGIDKKNHPISQAAYIKALQKTFLSKMKGIFVSPIINNQYLMWDLNEQSSFIALIWKEIYEYYKNNESDFSYNIFDHNISMLTKDQGVNGVMRVTNELIKLQFKEYKIDKLTLNTTDEDDLDSIIGTIKESSFYEFVQEMCRLICYFEWRLGTSDDLSEEQRNIQNSYKGSGGYKSLYINLLKQFSKAENEVSQLASELLKDQNEH